MSETHALSNLIAVYAGIALMLLAYLVAFRLRCRDERRRRD